MYFQYDWNKLRVLKRTHNGIIVEKNPIHRQHGTVIVFVTLTLITIFSFAALAIDVGYLFVVRNELQNAADAAALTLAGELYPLNGGNPNWANATSSTNITTAIALNKVGNAQLTNPDVSYGYWNITGNPLGLQSTSSPHPLSNEYPAVKVTISKSNATFFARILGVNTLDAKATAVAVAGISPATTTSPLMPFTIPKCVFDNTALWLNGEPIPNKTITLGSVYSGTTCGNTAIPVQWTSFGSGSQADSYTRTLIEQATGQAPAPNPPTTLSIGDNIWVQSGTQANLYSTGGQNNENNNEKNNNNENNNNNQQASIKGCSVAGDDTCAYAMVPVVQNINTGSNNPIVGFACIKILTADGTGSTKTISVQLVEAGTVPQCQLSGNGGGPSFGANIPPKLVNYSGNTY
ncbi:MAG: hypothetical protein RLZ75_1422 [Pseudomonadota bacterium]|jgi:Flp pilus assembly protein TadG